MPSKPWIKFYLGDHVADVLMANLSLEAEGACMRYLCYLWHNNLYEYTGNLLQWQELLRADERSVTRALREWEMTTFFEISYDTNKCVTVTSRRLLREHNARDTNRLRQKRFRDRNARVTPDVTPHITGRGQRPDTNTPYKSPTGDEAPAKKRKPPYTARMKEDFVRFWNIYPRKTHRARAERAWSTIRPDPDTVERILAQLRIESRDFETRPTDRIPYPSTWLNDRTWETDSNGDGFTPNPVGTAFAVRELSDEEANMLWGGNS